MFLLFHCLINNAHGNVSEVICFLYVSQGFTEVKSNFGTIMAYFIMILVLITTLEISTSEAVNSVKVAAFNVQVFGQTKISKNDVPDILAKVCKPNCTIHLTFICRAAMNKLKQTKTPMV